MVMSMLFEGYVFSSGMCSKQPTSSSNGPGARALALEIQMRETQRKIQEIADLEKVMKGMELLKEEFTREEMRRELLAEEEKLKAQKEKRKATKEKRKAKKEPLSGSGKKTTGIGNVLTSSIKDASRLDDEGVATKPVTCKEGAMVLALIHKGFGDAPNPLSVDDLQLPHEQGQGPATTLSRKELRLLKKRDHQELCGIKSEIERQNQEPVTTFSRKEERLLKQKEVGRSSSLDERYKYVLSPFLHDALTEWSCKN